MAIIQSRMGSTRLPGKALADINGQPALKRVIGRVKRASLIDEVVVATTVKDEDDPIVELTESCGTSVFRGSSSDVLLRYVEAAKEASANVVVRMTADCPLLDPEVIDRVIGQLTRTIDYCSNVVRRTYPRGLDIEVMHRDVLERIDRLATSPQAREHVTVGIYKERPHLFQIRHVLDQKDNSDLNFCLDTEADLHYLRRLWEDIGYQDLVAKARAMNTRAMMIAH